MDECNVNIQTTHLNRDTPKHTWLLGNCFSKSTPVSSSSNSSKLRASRSASSIRQSGTTLQRGLKVNSVKGLSLASLLANAISYKSYTVKKKHIVVLHVIIRVFTNRGRII